MFAEINGVKVHYELSGTDGPRVLLLHGWGCSCGMMQPVADGLKDGHFVMAVDFPGHGQSDRPPEPWGVPEYAACIQQLLDVTGFFPCSVVAHSFGCRVAVWLASENSSLFTRLVLTGAAGLKKPQTEEARKRSEMYRKEKNILRGIGHIPGLAHTSERLQEKLVQKYGSADYKALDAEMRKTFNRIIQLDLKDRYPKIQQSTLLVWGENDSETPLWMGQAMEKMIPDAGLVLFEGGTHFAYLEQIARFNTILKSFL